MRGKSKIERVLYWTLYFKTIRAVARETIKKQNELWWGKEGDAPQGILNNMDFLTPKQ